MQAFAKKVLSGCITVAELIESQEELLRVHIIDERFSRQNCTNAKITKCLLNLSRIVGEQHLKTHTNKPVISIKSYDNLDSWLRHLSNLTNK